tara:strand:+ start:1116 stop:1703 length:588 start_codon:yes stop_codon:yes gene_type:complete
MNKFVYLVIFVSIVMGLGANWVINKAQNSIDIPIIKQVPEFSYLNHKGESYTNKNFNEKVTVLDFIFTSCTGPCPIMTFNMENLYKDFKGIEQVQFLSITVDPYVDTQDKLKMYAELIGVNDNRWQFLRSDIDDIKNLKRNGFMLYADNLPNGHSIKFILIDHRGNIRKYYDGTDKASQEILKKDIVYLVNEIKT